MGGEGVPQGVRRRALRKAQSTAQTLDEPLHLPRPQGTTPIRAKQGIFGFEAEGQDVQVRVHLLSHEG